MNAACTTSKPRPLLLALAALNVLMRAGASPAAIAAFVNAQPTRVSIALSHMIEDQAHDGTFAAAVFHILAS